MKLITLDYGCGTSSSILDYNIQDAILISENNFNHIFEIEDDFMFIGHDFLFFLWDSDEKIKKWIQRSTKFEHWVWCFERVDAIVPIWLQKSHLSLNILNTFAKRIFASDESDCDKYNFEWLPQWASNHFYNKRHIKPINNSALFSGQSDKPEYAIRTQLLNSVKSDIEIANDLYISNRLRQFNWDNYVSNLLNHSRILNPIGTLMALNTRAYETIYSGRLLLQQTIGQYKRHEELLKNVPNVIFFENFNQLKQNLIKTRNFEIVDIETNFDDHSLIARMKSIGINIK